MFRALLSVPMVLAFAGGCYTEADVGGPYAASPSLEYVSPGVDVVADYDYPVFFADGFYWRSYGGLWYSSPYWNRGWALSYNVPFGIRGIARPWLYSHYHVPYHGYRPGVAYRGGVRGGAVYRGGRGGHRR